jgi:hypothetical protein
MNTNTEIVPFGKYKDQPLELMLADEDYLSWVKGQPGLMRSLESRHPAIFNIIVTGGPETEDTPDHNALQLRFFDTAFQLAFLEVATGKSIEAYKEGLIKKAQQEQEKSFLEAAEKYSSQLKWCSKRIVECQNKIEGRNKESDYYDLINQKPGYRNLEYWNKELDGYKKQLEDWQQAQKIAEEQRNRPPRVGALKCDVEVECGFDVKLSINLPCLWLAWSTTDRRGYELCGGIPKSLDSPCGEYWLFKIELKPQLGDNFPSVLRQMERNEAEILVVDSFTASNCSLDQLRAFFATKKMKVITLSEVEQKINR